MQTIYKIMAKATDCETTVLLTSFKVSLLLVFAGVLTLTTSCSTKDVPVDEATVRGVISSYNAYDDAILDITKADLANAGFAFGDSISVTIGDNTFAMPYYDGYYTRNGELLFVAYPSYPTICFTASGTGLPKELTGLEGQAVTVRMKKKGGCLSVQTAMSMKYSNDRNSYPELADAEYANARVVSVGNIANGVLYRSSTPFTDVTCRAYYVSDYLESQGIATVLNLADTEEKMLSYTMPTYSRTLWEEGHVMLCPLKADPTAAGFNNRLIATLKELPSRPAPYLVHCMEGKDRTGYACALLEGLCGATYEEMVADYLVTYDNYYHVNPQTNSEACNILVTLKLNPCLMHYAGVNDEAQLPNVDYAKAFSAFLLAHGMSEEQLDALV